MPELDKRNGLFGVTAPQITPEEQANVQRQAALEDQMEQYKLELAAARGGTRMDQVYGTKNAAKGFERRVQQQAAQSTPEMRQAQMAAEIKQRISQKEDFYGTLPEDRRLEDGLKTAAQVASEMGMENEAIKFAQAHTEAVRGRLTAESNLAKLQANTAAAQKKADIAGQRTVDDTDDYGNEVAYELDSKGNPVGPARITSYGKYTPITYTDASGEKVTDMQNAKGEIQELELSPKDRVEDAIRARNESIPIFKDIDIKLDTIDKAMELVDPLNTGAIGSWLAEKGAVGPVQEAADLNALLTPLFSSLAFDRLDRMREESKTGGALGAVSKIELELLMASLVSLEQSMGSSLLKENLQVVRDHYSAFRDAIRGDMQANAINWDDPKYAKWVTTYPDGAKAIRNPDTMRTALIIPPELK